MESIALNSDPELTEIFPPTMACEWNALPLSKLKNGSIRVAVTEKNNFEILDNLKTFFGASITPYYCSPAQLKEKFINSYGLGAQHLSIDHQETSLKDFVNELIFEANKQRATDIHIEPFEKEILVRFRIDGVLRLVQSPKSLTHFYPLLVSRIKVMADLNITEKRLPQDGRIRFPSSEGDVDIRVSILPTIFGESIDLRLLPQNGLILSLDKLGLKPEQAHKLRRFMNRTSGICLVTGPTGHGKTTTLYTCLNLLNTADRKIITLEDPVEYRLRGINQIQTKPNIGMTFSSGLRSILRQDPDVIMVGEIRDNETAEIAIRAALTGHLVFSTLHTIDTVGAITRLLDMGIEPYLVASSLNMVVAQRLIRLRCESCLGNKKIDCRQCQGSGFYGRTGIFEILTIDDSLREGILNRESTNILKEKAKLRGLV